MDLDDDDDVVITSCSSLSGEHSRAFREFAQTSRRATANRVPEPQAASVKHEPRSSFSERDRESDIDEELPREMNDRPNRRNSSRNRNQETNGMTSTYESPEDRRHSETMAVLSAMNKNLCSLNESQSRLTDQMEHMGVSLREEISALRRYTDEKFADFEQRKLNRDEYDAPEYESAAEARNRQERSSSTSASSSRPNYTARPSARNMRNKTEDAANSSEESFFPSVFNDRSAHSGADSQQQDFRHEERQQPPRTQAAQSRQKPCRWESDAIMLLNQILCDEVAPDELIGIKSVNLYFV